MLDILTAITQEDYSDFFERIIKASLVGNYTQNDYQTAKDYIFEKIWLVLKQSSYYFIEEKYVEPEWKEMISLHYINTTYCFDNYVCRVHLFAGNNDLDQDYLGFFTLRKINEPTILFSKLYPNWNNLLVDNRYASDAHIVTACKDVHLLDRTISIVTTPYFVQDGVVTCCAHSNLLMFSEFLNASYGTNRIKINDIINNYSFSRERSFPTKGLNVPQICETFYNNGISVEVNGIIDYSNEKMTQCCIERIKSQIDSNIPVIMGFSYHAVLIIGYYIKNNKTNFVFYDDSGFLVAQLNNNSNYSSFIYSFDETILFQVKDKFVFFFFQPERVYTRSHDIIYKMNKLLEKKMSSVKNIRTFIADISLCKSFLKHHCIDENRKKDIDDFASQSKLHYAWCYELEYESKTNDTSLYFIYFIDSTFSINSRKIIWLGGNINSPFVVNETFKLNTLLQSTPIKNPPKFLQRAHMGGFLFGIPEKSFATNVASIKKDEGTDDFINLIPIDESVDSE